MEKILIIDDDKQIVRLLRQYLEKAGYVVFVGYDGQTAVFNLRREKPDLLILDLGLPDQDGWELTRKIRTDPQFATLPIIMLTARIEETDRIIGLEIGADDYITKPFNAREVVARVRALLRRVNMVQTTQTQRLQVDELLLDIDQHTLTISGNPVALTPTEFKLMLTFMTHPNSTFNREELLEKALGYAYEGMGRTLDSHIKNLRQKIEVDPKRPSYIQTVHRVGYKLVGSSQ